MIPFEDFPTAVLSLIAALLAVNVWLTVRHARPTRAEERDSNRSETTSSDATS